MRFAHIQSENRADGQLHATEFFIFVIQTAIFAESVDFSGFQQLNYKRNITILNKMLCAARLVFHRMFSQKSYSRKADQRDTFMTAGKRNECSFYIRRFRRA